MGNVFSCVQATADKRSKAKGTSRNHRARNLCCSSEKDVIPRSQGKNIRRPGVQRRAVHKEEWTLCDVDESDLHSINETNGRSLNQATRRAAIADITDEDEEDYAEDEHAVPADVLARIQKTLSAPPTPDTDRATILDTILETQGHVDTVCINGDVGEPTDGILLLEDENIVITSAGDTTVLKDGNNSSPAPDHPPPANLPRSPVFASLTVTPDDFDIYQSEDDNEPEPESGTRIYHYDAERWEGFYAALEKEFIEQNEDELNSSGFESDSTYYSGKSTPSRSLTPDDDSKNGDGFIRNLLDILINQVGDIVSINKIIREADELESVSSQESGDDSWTPPLVEAEINMGQGTLMQIEPRTASSEESGDDRLTPSLVEADINKDQGTLKQTEPRTASSDGSGMESLTPPLVEKKINRDLGISRLMEPRAGPSEESGDESLTPPPVEGEIYRGPGILKQPTPHSATNDSRKRKLTWDPEVKSPPPTNRHWKYYDAISDAFIREWSKLRAKRTRQERRNAKLATMACRHVTRRGDGMISPGCRIPVMLSYKTYREDRVSPHATTGSRTISPGCRLPLPVKRNTSLVPGPQVQRSIQAIKQGSRIPVISWTSLSRKPDTSHIRSIRSLNLNGSRIPLATHRKTGGSSMRVAIAAFRRTGLFKQRFRMCKQGSLIWKQGLAPYQIRTVERATRTDIDVSLPTKTKTRPGAVKARISSRRKDDQRYC